jgi:hypothetical protein
MNARWLGAGGHGVEVIMKIHVTQEDIEQGKRFECDHCPVALAIKRTTGMSVSVHSDKISLASGQFTTPVEVVAFIDMFDGRLAVQPFEFEISFD